MLKMYGVLRIIFLSLIALTLISIGILSVSFSMHSPWLQEISDTPFYTNYSRFNSILVFDPYTQRTLQSKSRDMAMLTNIIKDRVASLIDFSDDKIFNEQLFSFYISQKIDDIKSLADKYFLGYADFRDMVIIDKEKNLIFKYGMENFPVQYYDITNSMDAVYFENLLALVLKSDDSTLEYEYQIITLFDYTEFNAVLKDISSPAFVFLRDRLMRNQQFKKSVFQAEKANLPALHKKRIGMKILETQALYAGKSLLGYTGVMYPVRNLGSYLIFILKIGVLVFLGVGLLKLDKWIVSSLNDQQIIREEAQAFKQENKQAPTEDEGVTDTNLEWVESFIEESEVKK